MRVRSGPQIRKIVGVHCCLHRVKDQLYVLGVIVSVTTLVVVGEVVVHQSLDECRDQRVLANT